MKKRGDIPEDLDTKVNAETPLTFPNGCHIAEVEIDPETGELTLVGYAAVDDCGNVAQPHDRRGPDARRDRQGLGQAMMEHAVLRLSGGQLVTGSFMDYAMPRAARPAAVQGRAAPVPATTNPLGVKGAGEAGTTAAIAAVMNAIADAIPGGAGANLDMPATPEKLWRACQAAGASAPAIRPPLCPGPNRAQHLAVLDRHLVGAQRDEARRRHGLAGFHVERAEVQRALDDVAVEDAVCETRGAMRALVIGGVERAADVVDRERRRADLILLHRVLAAARPIRIRSSAPLRLAERRHRRCFIAFSRETAQPTFRHAPALLLLADLRLTERRLAAERHLLLLVRLRLLRFLVTLRGGHLTSVLLLRPATSPAPNPAK